MQQLIKGLFGLAILNILIYIFYAIAFILYLPNFGVFGIMAILLILISFFSARGFYKLFDVSGIERIKSIVIVHTVILVIISAFNIFLIPLLQETANNIKQVQNYRQFKKGKAPIENGVWKYRKANISSKNKFLVVPCKDGQIDGEVVFVNFDEDEEFKADFYTKGQLDSTTFWKENHQVGRMFLRKTLIETDTFFYHLDFENIGNDVQKIGINEKGDTILKTMSPVISKYFEFD